MNLTGLHILLTFKCTFECAHCFVWGSPQQEGALTLERIEGVLEQAKELGTVRTIYFEGGEPFLYYGTLLGATRLALNLSFEVGIVTNAYWAIGERDAGEWLAPFAGLIQDLSISSDLYHYDEKLSQQAENALIAAQKLGIPVGLISIAQPESEQAQPVSGQIPAFSQYAVAESGLMYRGRAVEELAGRIPGKPWEQFTTCPHEDLREPGRVHLDPSGNLHICQGISIGNLFQTPLDRICARYNPDAHPITGPLLRGGPAELVRRFGLPHLQSYADACHLCYASRQALRHKFPEILAPDQMYGIFPD